MSFIMVLGLVALLGASGSFSSAINSSVGRNIGLMHATFLFLSLGTLFSAILVYLFEDGVSLTALATIAQERSYLFIPGFINVLFIMTIIRVTNVIGTMLTTACLFSGQMLNSLWLDHIGFLGLRTIPATIERITAVAILLLGVALLTVSQKSTSPGLPTIEKPSSPSKLTSQKPNGYAVLAALTVGGVLSGANALNATLGQEVGTFTATMLFLAPGVVLLPLASLVLSQQKQHLWQHQYRLIYFIPGTLNVATIAGSVFLIPHIGLQLMISTTFTAKVLAGLFVDRYGLFGVPRSPITLLRLLAATILGFGVFLSAWHAG